jgi:sn-glycerol 3-phosphate transport system ATP-binding protein
MTMADRMIVMNGGVAEQIGSPLEVYETPQTLFAAQFIGSPAMNIFDGTLQGGNLSIDGQHIAATGGPDGAVKVGMRPEHLELDETGPLTAAIQMSEPLGANTLLHGHLSSGSAAITASLPGVHVTGPEGRDMRFNIAPQNIHLFDPATGQRLNMAS